VISVRRADTYLREAAKALLNYRGQRHHVLRRWIFDLMRRFSPSIAVERNGIRYYVDTTDREVGRWVFGSGGFDDQVMSRAIAILESKIGRAPLLEERTFIDIGANIGTSTISALKVFGAERAVAVEPAPANYKLLQCNLIANDLTARVQALQVALSDTRRTAVLELSRMNSGDHRILRADDRHSARRTGTAVEVTVIRFDDLVDDLGIDLDRVGLVWMDAQGHEGHILAAANSLLRSDTPVVLEYWPHGLRASGCLTTLHEIVAGGYREVIDLRASTGGSMEARYPAADITRLEDRYRGPDSFTDLILLK
jgi:FkbM family methyltransferase